MASGLSDVLRDLAAGDPQQPAPSDEQPPAARVRAAKPTAKPRPANVADESGEIIADAPAAKPRQRPASARAPQRRKPQNTGMKMVAAPALLAVALLLLAIGIWGSLVLMGKEVWRSDQPGARQIAIAMQACYPIALCLLGGAVLFFMQGRGGKR